MSCLPYFTCPSLPGIPSLHLVIHPSSTSSTSGWVHKHHLKGCEAAVASKPVSWFVPLASGTQFVCVWDAKHLILEPGKRDDGAPSCASPPNRVRTTCVRLCHSRSQVPGSGLKPGFFTCVARIFLFRTRDHWRGCPEGNIQVRRDFLRRNDSPLVTA